MGKQGEEHDGLGSRGDDHGRRVDADPAAGRRIGGDRLAQLGQAHERAVVGPAGVERPLGRLADIGWRVEVGLADLQVDDLAARGLQGTRARRRLERCLGADVDDAVGQAHPCMLAPASWRRGRIRP
jgi:hypothetical protein